MAYRVTGEGYSPFFREQEDGRADCPEDDIEDGYTCLLCNTSYEKVIRSFHTLSTQCQQAHTMKFENPTFSNKMLRFFTRKWRNSSLVQLTYFLFQYLRKQTAALREVNDSRLRIYEQLEISIAELETNNHRLNTQSTNDKKHIANLENQIEKLESRCEELLRKVEDYERARNDAKGAPAAPGKRDAAEMAGLKEQLSELRTQNCRYVSKLQELQTTIDTVTQENLRLEETVLSMQRKQDEMTVIDQVRQGQICRRCLRATDDMTSLGDEDDVSIIDSLINDDSYQSLLRESLADMSDSNPYRTLVEKYEALLEVQAAGKVPAPLRPAYATHETSKCLSLQEELAMSGFSSFHREEDDGEYEVSQVRQVAKSTPDFSETETSSSGFADETMNKGTQTEATVPGAFLCSITDGDDCKFSIYDEASPIETRFRKTPEYKKLFREIFDVLKRAAEAKDEGETLPLLEDQTPMCEVPPKVPPVTPLVEDVPEVPEAGNLSGACAEQPSSSGGTAAENAKRDILESLTHGVGGRSTPSDAKRATWCGDGAPSFVAPAAAVSSASHDVARLKQLEKSYAEVLRLGRQQVNRVAVARRLGRQVIPAFRRTKGEGILLVADAGRDADADGVTFHHVAEEHFTFGVSRLKKNFVLEKKLRCACAG
ncbi:unnamed protein product [Nesidiocoris tenuis]|uniref:Uncharacterized protein n=1 Tax=Nesidiocoris tenuis TaxID=355587 RepID=A0A6H5FVR7_9HEMI|nr:unnamed protein product [Nesidiocoris tenuis]